MVAVTLNVSPIDGDYQALEVKKTSKFYDSNNIGIVSGLRFRKTFIAEAEEAIDASITELDIYYTLNFTILVVDLKQIPSIIRKLKKFCKKHFNAYTNHNHVYSLSPND